MVDKKAYIRTVEAVIAIVLLLFTTYALTPKQMLNPRETPYAIESAQKYVITKITENNTIRQIILDYDNGDTEKRMANETLHTTIKERLPAGYDYSAAICDNPSCVTLPELQTSVYSDDVLIAGQTSGTESIPVIRLVRFWFWRL